jgi:hypothetical protein
MAFQEHVDEVSRALKVAGQREKVKGNTGCASNSVLEFLLSPFPFQLLPVSTRSRIRNQPKLEHTRAFRDVFEVNLP